MSTLFESEVTAARNATPWTGIRLAEMMKDLACERTDTPQEVALECVYRHSVSSRFWWTLRWIGADGQRHVADAQTLDLCLWRAAVREQKTRAKLDSSNAVDEERRNG